MQLNIKEILKFYDESNVTNRKHASAITGVIGEDVAISVFYHYLHSQDSLVVPRDEPCTQGKRGNRLDKWLYVEAANDKWLYQVEVKNWTAHSYGGRHLALDATAEQIRELKKARWAELWDNTAKRFRDSRIDKVLLPMRSPLPNLRVEPLVIFWFAVHPRGEESAFFEVETQGEFRRVFIFSISSYLRALNSETIQVDVPRIIERLLILKRLLVELEVS